MVVVCTDVSFLPFFTYGERYTVLDNDKFFHFYEVTNDLGTLVVVNSKFFKKVDSHREKIINDILK